MTTNPDAKQNDALLRGIVNAQAEDEGLWFQAKTAPEAYLQQELRKLHAAIELRELPTQPAVQLSGWRSIDEWNEDDGAVLWCRVPVEEPYYFGTPLDDAHWIEDYYTHWLPKIFIPAPPQQAIKSKGGA